MLTSEIKANNNLSSPIIQQQPYIEQGYNSLIKLFDDISCTIEHAQHEYLDYFHDSLKKGMEKYHKISGVLSELSNYVEESDKDNFIKLKQQKLLQDLQNLRDELTHESASLAYQKNFYF